MTSNLLLITFVNLVKLKLKAGNIAADGAITIVQDGNKAILVEVNCQTDFVAKDENFSNFAHTVAAAALAAGETDAAKIAELKLADGQSVEEARIALVQKSVKTSKFVVRKSLKANNWLSINTV